MILLVVPTLVLYADLPIVRNALIYARIADFMIEHGGNFRLFGEWMVPHTFKQYRDEVWRKFYVFDVWHIAEERWLSYSRYWKLCADFGLHVIEPLAIIKNPAPQNLQRLVESNTYLIKDGGGPGEGIVIKNYEWKNKYGCQPWAKLVRNEFKEENRRAFGVHEPGSSFQIEAAIAEEFVTSTLVNKELAKIIYKLGDEDIAKGVGPKDTNLAFEGPRMKVLERHRGQIIPRLLQTIYHCIVTEELWAALKKHKNPVIDFRRLRQFVIVETKKQVPHLF